MELTPILIQVRRYTRAEAILEFVFQEVHLSLYRCTYMRMILVTTPMNMWALIIFHPENVIPLAV